MQDSTDAINWIKVSFWTSIAVIFFFVVRHFYPDTQWFFPPSIVIIFSFIWFFSVGKSIIWVSRYRGYWVAVNGIAGSIYGKPEYISDPSMGKDFYWAVLNLGYSHFPPLRGKLSTLVVPADQLYPAGKNYIGLTLVQLVPLSLIPPRVNNFLRRNESSFNLEKIYFGLYSQNFVDNSGNHEDLVLQLQAKDSYINVLQKAVENKFDTFEEIKEFADRLTGNKFSIKKLVSKATKDDDE